MMSAYYESRINVSAGLDPASETRAYYFPYTREEAPFVEEIAWATEEEILLRHRQPAVSDPNWTRSMHLAHRVLHGAQKRIAAIRRERRARGIPTLTAADAGRSAAELERLIPEDFRPRKRVARKEGVEPVIVAEEPEVATASVGAVESRGVLEVPAILEDTTVLAMPMTGPIWEEVSEGDLESIALIPGLEPRHLVYVKTCETLESYFQLLVHGMTAAELMEMDPRLERVDVGVIRRALGALLHHPVDRERLPGGVAVHEDPGVARKAILIREAGRASRQRQQLAAQ